MGKGKSNRNCDNDNIKDGEVAKLKRHIYKLEKELHKLRSENKTYRKVFDKNITFLKEKTADLSVEELIAGADKELNLREIREENKQNFEEMQRKWQCRICLDGIMKLIIIPNGDGGSRYFRKCSSHTCSNRTAVKNYTEDVDKGIS